MNLHFGKSTPPDLGHLLAASCPLLVPHKQPCGICHFPEGQTMLCGASKTEDSTIFLMFAAHMRVYKWYASQHCTTVLATGHLVPEPYALTFHGLYVQPECTEQEPVRGS